MVKIIDKRKEKESLVFEDVKYGTPFCFKTDPKKIYVVVDDTIIVDITNDFEALDVDDFNLYSECEYVNLNIEIA